MTLTDEQVNEKLDEIHRALTAKGFNGGMAGETWSQAVYRAGMAAVLQPKPNQFWNNDDPDRCHSSIHGALEREWLDGLLEIGVEMTIQQALRLPNIKVRVIADPKDPDGFDYEEVNDPKT